MKRSTRRIGLLAAALSTVGLTSACRDVISVAEPAISRRTEVYQAEATQVASSSVEFANASTGFSPFSKDIAIGWGNSGSGNTSVYFPHDSTVVAGTFEYACSTPLSICPVVVDSAKFLLSNTSSSYSLYTAAGLHTLSVDGWQTQRFNGYLWAWSMCTMSGKLPALNWCSNRNADGSVDSFARYLKFIYTKSFSAAPSLNISLSRVGSGPLYGEVGYQISASSSGRWPPDVPARYAFCIRSSGGACSYTQAASYTSTYGFSIPCEDIGVNKWIIGAVYDGFNRFKTDSLGVSASSGGPSCGPPNVIITGYTDANSGSQCRLRYTAVTTGRFPGGVTSIALSTSTGSVHEAGSDYFVVSYDNINGGKLISAVVTDGTGGTHSAMLEVNASSTEYDCFGPY